MKFVRITIIALLLSLFTGLTFAQTDTSITAMNVALSQQLEGYEQQVAELAALVKTEKNLTDNRLRVFRQELLGLAATLETQQATYNSRLDRAKKLIKEFADISDLKLSDKNKVDIEADAYYLKQINSFKKEVGFIQGRLLQIRLLQFQINNTLRAIGRRQVALHNGGILNADNPFYLAKSWRYAMTGFVSFSARLIDQVKMIGLDFLHVVKLPRFWLYLVGIIILVWIYFRYLVGVLLLKTLSHSNHFGHKSYRAFTSFIIRGLVPAGIILLLGRFFLFLLSVEETLLLDAFVNAIANALAFVMVVSGLIDALCYQIYRLDKTEAFSFVARWLWWLIWQIGLILFINNINFFSLDAKSFPYYPVASVALLNLIFAVSVWFTVIVLTRKYKAFRKEVKNA